MLTKIIRAICPFFYVNRIMINLIAVSGIEKYLLKNLNPVFFGTDYEIVRVKVYEKKEKIVQVMMKGMSEEFTTKFTAK